VVARCMVNRGSGKNKMYDRKKPTNAQRDFLQWLIQQTKTDPEWYDVDRMTRRQVQEAIDKLSDGVDVKKWEG